MVPDSGPVDEGILARHGAVRAEGLRNISSNVPDLSSPSRLWYRPAASAVVAAPSRVYRYVHSSRPLRTLRLSLPPQVPQCSGRRAGAAPGGPPAKRPTRLRQSGGNAEHPPLPTCVPGPSGTLAGCPLCAHAPISQAPRPPPACPGSRLSQRDGRPGSEGPGRGVPGQPDATVLGPVAWLV